ncbi:MAG: response regulator, partial [Anaerolineae bacterium]|nr:response regulator [Phycisphaerae bacterium]
PEMSGIDVLRTLRSDRKNSEIPVIILTAGCTPQEEQEARTLGVSGMLRKGSVEIAEIVTAIQSILSRSNATRPSC